MKTLCKKLVLVLVALVIALGSSALLGGCKKKETAPLQNAIDQTKTTADQAKKDATKTADQTKKTVEKAVEPNK
jgi:mannitol-specific phosphotransferase system IIBC component